MQALAIKIFKMIYRAKIHGLLLEHVNKTDTELDNKFLLSLDKFVESL